jgi:hypothetical protein
MGAPATYRDGDAFQWDWEVNPSDPSDGPFATETIFPTETIRPSDPSFLPTYSDASSTAFWEHQYDFRPGTFTLTDYSFDLPSGDAVDPSDPSNGLNPTESIFPTESILPANSFLPLEQGGVVLHDIHYDPMI